MATRLELLVDAAFRQILAGQFQRAMAHVELARAELLERCVECQAPALPIERKFNHGLCDNCRDRIDAWHRAAGSTEWPKR